MKKQQLNRNKLKDNFRASDEIFLYFTQFPNLSDVGNVCILFKTRVSAHYAFYMKTISFVILMLIKLINTRKNFARNLFWEHLESDQNAEKPTGF